MPKFAHGRLAATILHNLLYAADMIELEGQHVLVLPVDLVTLEALMTFDPDGDPDFEPEEADDDQECEASLVPIAAGVGPHWYDQTRWASHETAATADLEWADDDDLGCNTSGVLAR